MVNILKKLDEKEEMPYLKNREIKFTVTKTDSRYEHISRFYLLKIKTNLKKFAEEELTLGSSKV